MPNFKYKVRDRFSKLVGGNIIADTSDAAAKRLKEMGYTPVYLVKDNEKLIKKTFSKFKKVSLQDLNIFTRQICSLQRAGVSLLSSLHAISVQMKNQYFKSVIDKVADDVMGGLSLSESLKKHSNVFDSIYIGMVKAAEASGRIVDILEKLTMLIEQDMDTKAKIKSATRYPLIALSVLCLGFIIVITFVVPRFASVYGSNNAALPLPTLILINTNKFISQFWYVVIIGIVGLIFAFKRFVSSVKGRVIWDNFKLKIPVFGNLALMLTMARFTRITGILMLSGVPILEVLNLVSATAGNVIVARAIENIRRGVSKGEGMFEPMKVSKLFPPIVMEMTSVGEQTGKTDELLLSVADYYDREAAYMIKNLTTYIEPILILVLAVMVSIMALGIFMPMWNLIKVFKN